MTSELKKEDYPRYVWRDLITCYGNPGEHYQIPDPALEALMLKRHSLEGSVDSILGSLLNDSAARHSLKEPVGSPLGSLVNSSVAREFLKQIKNLPNKQAALDLLDRCFISNAAMSVVATQTPNQRELTKLGQLYNEICTIRSFTFSCIRIEYELYYLLNTQCSWVHGEGRCDGRYNDIYKDIAYRVFGVNIYANFPDIYVHEGLERIYVCEGPEKIKEQIEGNLRIWEEIKSNQSIREAISNVINESKAHYKDKFENGSVNWWITRVIRPLPPTSRAVAASPASSSVAPTQHLSTTSQHLETKTQERKDVAVSSLTTVERANEKIDESIANLQLVREGIALTRTPTLTLDQYKRALFFFEHSFHFYREKSDVISVACMQVCAYKLGMLLVTYLPEQGNSGKARIYLKEAVNKINAINPSNIPAIQKNFSTLLTGTLDFSLDQVKNALGHVESLLATISQATVPSTTPQLISTASPAKSASAPLGNLNITNTSTTVPRPTPTPAPPNNTPDRSAGSQEIKAAAISSSTSSETPDIERSRQAFNLYHKGVALMREKPLTPQKYAESASCFKHAYDDYWGGCLKNASYAVSLSNTVLMLGELALGNPTVENLTEASNYLKKTIEKIAEITQSGAASTTHLHLQKIHERYEACNKKIAELQEQNRAPLLSARSSAAQTMGLPTSNNNPMSQSAEATDSGQIPAATSAPAPLQVQATSVEVASPATAREDKFSSLTIVTPVLAFSSTSNSTTNTAEVDTSGDQNTTPSVSTVSTAPVEAAPVKSTIVVSAATNESPAIAPPVSSHNTQEINPDPVSSSASNPVTDTTSATIDSNERVAQFTSTVSATIPADTASEQYIEAASPVPMIVDDNVLSLPPVATALTSAALSTSSSTTETSVVATSSNEATAQTASTTSSTIKQQINPDSASSSASSPVTDTISVTVDNNVLPLPSVAIAFTSAALSTSSPTTGTSVVATSSNETTAQTTSTTSTIKSANTASAKKPASTKQKHPKKSTPSTATPTPTATSTASSSSNVANSATSTSGANTVSSKKVKITQSTSTSSSTRSIPTTSEHKKTNQPNPPLKGAAFAAANLGTFAKKSNSSSATAARNNNAPASAPSGVAASAAKRGVLAERKKISVSNLKEAEAAIERGKSLMDIAEAKLNFEGVSKYLETSTIDVSAKGKTRWDLAEAMFAKANSIPDIELAKFYFLEVKRLGIASGYFEQARGKIKACEKKLKELNQKPLRGQVFT